MNRGRSIILIVFGVLLLCLAVHYFDRLTMVNKKAAVESMSSFSSYLSIAIDDENYSIKHPNDIQSRKDVATEIDKADITMGAAEPLFNYYGVNNVSSVHSIMLYLLEYNNVHNKTVVQYLDDVSPEVKQFIQKRNPTINDIKQLINQLSSAYAKVKI
ncbi:hypothetical protein [Alicyclobacillus fodiniaquatilis]|uniref:Uncharacterized protein n=1 Tax=Alicyclobacillus fodiniaquatilis TaxID=1661150 RepID=A0ABW4JKR9_9BACL